MFRVGLFLLSCFLFPFHSLFASVSISEVAWMGDSESPNHEWLELFNAGEAVSVEDWTLSDNANLNISLTGTIPANSYIILERNRSDGGSVVGTPFLNYAGALVNTGATLILRDAFGSVIDQVAGGEDWQNIGGDNLTKDTAQYTSSGWITTPPTPGRANATTVKSPPPTSTTVTNSSQSSSLTTKITNSVSLPPASLPTPLSLQLTVPEYLYVGQSVAFTVVPLGSIKTVRNSLVYEWNFGDFYTGTSSTPLHSYQYPGTYTVVVNATFAKFSAQTRQTVTVLPVTTSLSYTSSGDILLQNDALYEIDISGYYLTSTKTKKIPAYSYISPRETITIPWQMVGIAPFPVTYLFASDQTLIASTQPTVVGVTKVTPTVNPTAKPLNTFSVESVTNSPPEPTANFGFATTITSTSSLVDQTLIGTQPTTSSTQFQASQFANQVATSSDLAIIPILNNDTNSTPASDNWVFTWLIYLVFIFLLAGAFFSINFKKNTETSK